MHHTELSIQGIQQPTYPLELQRKDGSTCMTQVTEFSEFDERNNVTSVKGLVKVLDVS